MNVPVFPFRDCPAVPEKPPGHPPRIGDAFLKRLLLFLAVLVICLSAAISDTHAYFTTQKAAYNVVTAGNIRISVTDAFSGSLGNVVPSAVLPGKALVQNTGKHAAYVRIRVEKSFSSPEGAKSAPDPELICLNVDSAHWKWKDGFYYYATALEPGRSTEPLFSSITFSPRMGDECQGCTASVRLLISAVQADNNGSNPQSAAGWP